MRKWIGWLRSIRIGRANDAVCLIEDGFRVDEILVDLKASPADAKKLGEISIKDSQFGDVSWPEAKGMFASYEKVVGELKELQKKAPLIGDVRGSGLMIGIELVAVVGSEQLREAADCAQRCPQVVRD